MAHQETDCRKVISAVTPHEPPRGPQTTALREQGLEQIYAWKASGVHVRLNMAVDSNGTFADVHGTSQGLSSPDDRSLVKLIRSGADVVVVGANTIRAEGWNLPPHGLLAVLSRSGELPWETCKDSARVQVFSESPTAKEIINYLESAGFRTILVEGGGVVARMFAEENLFDDICLTVSSPDGLPTDDALSLALTSLLPPSEGHYDLVSKVPQAATHSIFALWRRALASASIARH